MHYHATEAVMIGWVQEQEGLNAPRLLRCFSRGQFASARRGNFGVVGT